MEGEGDEEGVEETKEEPPDTDDAGFITIPPKSERKKKRGSTQIPIVKTPPRPIPQPVTHTPVTPGYYSHQVDTASDTDTDSLNLHTDLPPDDDIQDDDNLSTYSSDSNRSIMTTTVDKNT